MKNEMLRGRTLFIDKQMTTQISLKLNVSASGKYTLPNIKYHVYS